MAHDDAIPTIASSKNYMKDFLKCPYSTYWLALYFKYLRDDAIPLIASSLNIWNDRQKYFYTPLAECGVYWNTLVRPSVRPFVRPHTLCTQLVIYLLADFVHIWYVGWAWREHAHIISISRLGDFCRSCGPLWWKLVRWYVPIPCVRN